MFVLLFSVGVGWLCFERFWTEEAVHHVRDVMKVKEIDVRREMDQCA